MAKKKRKRTGLDRMADQLAMSLIFEASGGTIGRARKTSDEDKENQVSFRDRRALLDSITKLLGARDTEDDDEEDGIASFRERLNGTDSGTPERGTDASDVEN